MPLSRPAPQEERWVLLAARLGIAGKTPFITELNGGWKCVSLLARCLFFILGLVGAVMLTSILALLDVPAHFFLAGLLAIVTAESLIAQRRIFTSGIEEALEVTGLITLGIGLLNTDRIWDDADITWVIAAACLVAGIRLLNPLFSTVAAVALSLGLAQLIEPRTFHASPQGIYSASLLCCCLGVSALVLGSIRWQRPAYDRMFDWLVVAMPVAAYLWAASLHSFTAVDYWHARSLTDVYPPLVPLCFAIAGLIVGLRRRTHAPLLAFLLCIGCLAYELRALTGLQLEVRLIVWGSIALAAAVILDRVLRFPRRGITSQKVTEKTGPFDLISLAGVAALTPHTSAPADPQFEGKGGGFGGGGASGNY